MAAAACGIAGSAYVERESVNCGHLSHLLSDVVYKSAEFSVRNSTFQPLRAAVAAPRPPGTTISSMYSRGTATRLVSAMKNAPLLDDFRVEGTFLLRGEAPAGVYLLPLEALALVASHFALAIYVGKIKSEGGRSDGVVQATAVYKAIADCGIAIGRQIFSATQELVTEILAADVGASLPRVLAIIDACGDDVYSLVPHSVRERILPTPLPRGLWSRDFFLRGEGASAVVRLSAVRDLMLGVTPATREYNLSPGSLPSVGPSGVGFVNATYSCFRSKKPRSDSDCGKGLGCPACLDVFVPLYADDPLVIVLLGPPHVDTCGDSKFLALAPSVERLLVDILSYGAMPNFKIVNRVASAAIEAGKKYDEAHEIMKATGNAIVSRETTESARPRGARFGSAQPIVANVEHLMCLCACSASTDNALQHPAAEARAHRRHAFTLQRNYVDQGCCATWSAERPVLRRGQRCAHRTLQRLDAQQRGLPRRRHLSQPLRV